VITYGKVTLRARVDDDIAVLHRELYDDVATRVRADSRPWRPLTVTRSTYRADAAGEDTETFSVVEASSGELAGEAALWQIDTHNRSAHLAVAILPAFRGRGLAGDTLRALCEYGFTLRGLHRLQLETLADNEPMRRAAVRVGFRVEGQRRKSLWVAGEFSDDVIYGLLADDFAGDGAAQRADKT